VLDGSASRLPECGRPRAASSTHGAETEIIMSDELIEVTDREVLSREQAAARLHRLADELARHNQIAFVRAGTRYTVTVPDQVTLKVEIEVGEDNEIEFELTW